MLGSYREFEDYLARFTNYERLRLFKYDPETLGLERMQSFLDEIGNPERTFPAVHVAGTKGKGSTSLLLESLLRAEGFRVCTYTSPHVEHLRERIRLDGKPISEEAILAEVKGMVPALERRRTAGTREFPSFFELMTAVAMVHASRHAVDWGVFEVGLGGRLDATNVLRPRATAITSIGLEHTQQLGSSLCEIAREKAGIIKPQTPLVVGPLAAEAEQEILRIASERAAPVVRWDRLAVAFLSPSRIRVEGFGEFPAGRVLGPALRADLSIALALFEIILGPGSLRGDVIARALEFVDLPARVEVFHHAPPIVLDGAHTAASVQALRQTLDEIQFPGPRTVVFSIASGKDLCPILEEIPGIGEHVILTVADPTRSVPPGEIRTCLGSGTVIEDPESAFRAALDAGRPIVVTGSFYLAGRLRPAVRALAENRAPTFSSSST